MAGATTYWIVVRSTASGGNGYSYWHSGTELAYSGGSGMKSPDGSTWLPALHDYPFRVYGFVQPSWSFSASSSVASLEAAQTVAFRANFSNGGPGDAAALWVNVTLPPELVYVSNDSALIGGVSAGTHYRFNNLTPGSYSFNVTAAAIGGLPDGTVVSTDIAFAGTDHNGVPLSSTIRTLSVTIRSPRLSLTLASNVSIVTPGDLILLNATVTNIGGGRAYSVRIAGTVDANATFNASASGSYNSGTRTVDRTIPSVAPGAQANLVWDVRVPAGTPDGAVIHTVANATYRDGANANFPEERKSTTATVRAPVFNPALQFDRSSAEHGDQVAVTLYFNNTGSGPALSASANWTIGSDYALVSLSPAMPFTQGAGWFAVRWTNLPSGSHSLVARLQVLAGMLDGLVMPVSMHWDATDGNGNALPPATRSGSVVLRAPAPGIALAPASSQVAAGATVNVTVTLRNPGRGGAVGWLNTTFPAGLTYVDDNGSFTVTMAGSQASWAVTSLAPGTTALLGVRLLAAGPPAGLTLRFTFNYTDGRGSPVASLISNSVAIDVIRVPAFAPALQLDRRIAERGDEVVATLYFNNTGSAAGQSASANWTIGGNYVLVALTPVTPFLQGPGWFLVTWTNVAAGDHTLLARLRVIRGLTDGVVMPIQVHWAATDHVGSPLPPATLSGSVTLRAPAPTIALVMPAVVQVESDATFTATVTLRNPGGAAAIGWLNVSLPSALSYVDDNVSLAVTVAGNRVSWAVPSLAPGSSLTVGVRLRASGPPGSANLRFLFNYTDGKGSSVASIGSNPVLAEIVPVPLSIGVVAGIGVTVVAAMAVVAWLVIRRRRGGKHVIDDVFVVNDGGILLAHRSSSLVEYQDQDILMGMFKVVQDFVKDSFSKGLDEEMQGLEFGDRKILIEKAPHHFVAVVYRGPPTKVLRERVRAVSQEIERKFGDALAHYNGALDSVRGITLLLPQVWGQAS
ncbi:MAG: DUF11 domain-containing protein [Methanobacteriota archaeon]|nr:MAG: DUF11 domain-containing protein [Euryarchaeota archaeon]